jgi:hypothetical protein
MYFLNENKILKISFNKPIFKNIKTLYLKPELRIPYYDNSHLNYIYIEKIENINYIFYGFFKDDYFVIICDSYNTDLDINIKDKNIILLNLNWSLKKIDENKSIWTIDINNILKIDGYKLNIRKKSNKHLTANLKDFIRLCEYEVLKIYIEYVDKESKINNKHSLINMIKTYIKCNESL